MSLYDVFNIYFHILEKEKERRMVEDTGADLHVEQPTEPSVPLHPKCTFDPAVSMSDQFSALLETIVMCKICDIKLENLKDCISDISGQSSIDDIPDISSVKGALEFLANSVDVDFLKFVLQKFQCEICRTYLDRFEENMKRSHYSEHSLSGLKTGMKCVTGVFKGVDNSSDPVCADIIAKKSFCKEFDIKTGALRLVDCREREAGVIHLKWQIFPDLAGKFHEELTDRSLKTLEPLKLKSLKVDDNIALYFYHITDASVTEPTQQVSCLLVLYTFYNKNFVCHCSSLLFLYNIMHACI